MFNVYESGSVTVYEKEDDAAARTSLGTVVLSGTGEFARPYLPVDFRTKLVELTLETTLPMEFIGLIFDYNEDGEF
jgi:hypothetical protein